MSENAPLIVASDARDQSTRPIDRDEAHRDGIIHRAVHVEIYDQRGLLVWRRRDGRLEIPGGHVDWLAAENRAESYREAALRELTEELALPLNWQMSASECEARLSPELHFLQAVINQVPSRNAWNNEWVSVHRLNWQSDWGDPSQPSWVLDPEEGVTSASFRSVEELERVCTADPSGLTSSLRLLLARQGVLIPIVRR